MKFKMASPGSVGNTPGWLVRACFGMWLERAVMTFYLTLTPGTAHALLNTPSM